MSEQEIKQLEKSERELRKALAAHCELIRAFLNFIDAEMPKPPTPEKGKRISKAANQLELANDLLRYGILNVDFRKDKQGDTT